MRWTSDTPPPAPLTLDVPAAFDGFDEAGYLVCNPDIARDVDPSNPAKWQSGRQHFQTVGHTEPRLMRRTEGLGAARRAKLPRIKSVLRRWKPHKRRGLKYDFLTDALRKQTGIASTERVSSNHYDPSILGLIESCRDGVVLDCGAGRRNIYFPNIVNYDIVDYDTTDVIGVGEVLPFKSGVFDAVISIAVLEHVRDPFTCAAELVRVLKPGGRLVACVPFLQPYHGYPHHYYNMTHQGLRALFDRRLEIEDQQVPGSLLPIWPLVWIVHSWAAGLPPAEREKFLDVPLRYLLKNPDAYLDETWVRELAPEKNLELAGGTVLWARKPK